MSPSADDAEPSEETQREFHRDRDALATVIQAFAEKLLADPRSRETFVRVGLNEEFTEEETKLIYEELGLARAFEPAPLIPATSYSDITQALARRTVSGIYSSVHCAEATAFVKRNAFPLMSYEAANKKLPRNLGKLFKQFDIHFNKAPFEDYVRVFKYIANSRIFADYKQRLSETDRQGGDSREYKDLEYEIRIEESKIFRRHGLIGQFHALGDIGLMRYRGLDVNDDETIRKHLIPMTRAAIDFGE